MCGIAGCLALALEAGPDQAWLTEALDRIHHRGPDDDGVYTDSDVALGFRRLSILDLSQAGHQPMRSADGRFWMLFNGEIYNYVELAAELREQGVTLRSNGDAEVLLETYARVGKDVVHRLRGMYAIAIWDTWTRELFCARDPFGIKPFYYRIDRGPGTVSGGEANGARGGSNGGAPAPGPGPRPRGGRHAAPAAVSEPEQADTPAAPDDWFTRTARPARRPGRHAAGEPDGPGVMHKEDAPGAPSAAPTPARATGAGLRLRFASERKALAEPGELRDLDAVALRRYLAFQYVPAPDTITPPIQVLPPGHAMIARPGRPVDVYRFWRADLRPASQPSEAAPRAILAAMRDSIAVHLRSHAPLGAFLSGGIDSAAICALAAGHRPDLLTFTVGFEREGYSEIDRAQETAAAIVVRSIPCVITRAEFFQHHPQVIWHLDDPMADAAAVPLWFVAREASKHVKVVLSGEGSDELFGGYAIYHQPGVVRAGERLPDWGRAPIKKAAAMIPSGVKGRGFLERTSTPLRHRYIGNARVFSEN